MEHYAAIDVSLEWSSVCVVDAAGKIVREARVRSEREALVAFFAESGQSFARIGLEAGPLSQWLYAGLVEAGLPAILIETRHVKAALKAMTVKTDRNDARGMAQLMRMGWFRAVHVKAPMVQEIRALLTARKLLVVKLPDVESSLRGILRGFGLKVGAISRGKFEARIRELVAGQAMLERIAEPLLRASDPEFAAKLEDIVGLYVDPPKHAVVLSVDEKSQIQALDRTQPGLPLKSGKAGTMTHDYLRNGVTTLFAAFDVLEGTVLGRCMQRHRHQEFLRFLNTIERAVPAGKVIHVILDNYGSHKHPKVLR
jgi:hypothetical protein